MFDQSREEQLMSTITVTGISATQPRHLVTNEGTAITSFRFAATERRYDKQDQKWVDGDTTWFTVSAFRSLADNVKASVKKGERLIITGRLRIRDWEAGDKSGTDVEIEADSIGHDLTWGTSTYTRTPANGDATATAETTSPAPGTATA